MATATAEPTTVPRGPKPPLIRRVRIRNYKSIAFCDVALGPLTILIGRNGGGKSNFLDALAFLSDCLTMSSISQAARVHGGATAIRHRGSGDVPIEIALDLEFLSHESKPTRVHYAVKFGMNDDHQFFNQKEFLSAASDGSEIPVTRKIDQGRATEDDGNGKPIILTDLL